MNICSEHFGMMPDGREVKLFTLTNHQAMEVKIINYGGIITSINVPDRSGDFGDVVLGHDRLEGYLNRSRYFGALIGRHGNRIRQGRFVLNDTEYNLPINNGKNHLHGGPKGFDKVFWDAREVTGALRLTYKSWDGEEGYPGNLEATVIYSLTDANEVSLEYGAVTDKDTIVNLTNHSYFNLAGAGTILDHELTIHADAFTPVDETLIPTGELRPVKCTPMDFTSASAIGTHINQADEQLRFAGGGYDHNFVLRSPDRGLRTVATVHEPKTGRRMEVITTQPGLQFYSGNFLDGSIAGKGGHPYLKHSGFCLETQHFPDAPNHAHFPSTVLKPGEEYRQKTIYRFGVD
jgi:aldose 1-epimerase